MRKGLTRREIRKALQNGGLEILVPHDYVPSTNPDEAAYQDIDFHNRAWRSLLLAATGRDKISWQLLQRQGAIQRKRGNSTELRVNVLTIEAALNLQKAGYHLEPCSQTTSHRAVAHCV